MGEKTDWGKRRNCGRIEALCERMGLWEHRGFWEKLRIVEENGRIDGKMEKNGGL